MKRTCRRI